MHVIDHTVQGDDTSCDLEGLVGHLDLSLCAASSCCPQGSISLSTNTAAVNLCCHAGGNTTTSYRSEGAEAENTTLIHILMFTPTALNCHPVNTTGNCSCQVLQPRAKNGSFFDSLLSEDCVQNRNGTEMTPTNSSCIAPNLFYGVAGSLLLTNVMLLLVIMTLCAACLSHDKKVTLPYGNHTSGE